MNTKQHILKPGTRSFEASRVLGAWHRLRQTMQGLVETAGRGAAYLPSVHCMPQAGFAAINAERVGAISGRLGLPDFA